MLHHTVWRTWSFMAHSQEWSISNFPCSLTSNVTLRSRENLVFHSFTEMEEDYTTWFSVPHLNISLWEVGRMYFLNLGVKGLTKYQNQSRYRCRWCASPGSRDSPDEITFWLPCSTNQDYPEWVFRISLGLELRQVLRTSLPRLATQPTLLKYNYQIVRVIK